MDRVRRLWIEEIENTALGVNVSKHDTGINIKPEHIYLT